MRCTSLTSISIIISIHMTLYSSDHWGCFLLPFEPFFHYQYVISSVKQYKSKKRNNEWNFEIFGYSWSFKDHGMNIQIDLTENWKDARNHGMGLSTTYSPSYSCLSPYFRWRWSVCWKFQMSFNLVCCVYDTRLIFFYLIFNIDIFHVINGLSKVACHFWLTLCGLHHHNILRCTLF